MGDKLAGIHRPGFDADDVRSFLTLNCRGSLLCREPDPLISLFSQQQVPDMVVDFCANCDFPCLNSQHTRPTVHVPLGGRFHCYSNTNYFLFYLLDLLMYLYTSGSSRK